MSNIASSSFKQKQVKDLFQDVVIKQGEEEQLLIISSSGGGSNNSSGNSTTTSEDEEDDVIILEQVEETTKRELTMRDMANVLKENDKNASNNNNAMPLTSLNGWFNTGITVFVSVRRTSLIMLCTMLPFVVVQLFAILPVSYTHLTLPRTPYV